MLLKHSGFYLAAEAVPILLAIISISVYTRYLSTEEYALYSLVMTSVWLASAFLVDWLRMGLVRFWNMKEYSKEILVGSISSILNIIMLITLIVFSLTLYITSDYYQIPIAIMIAGFILFVTQTLFNLNMKIKNSLLKAKEYALINSFRAAISIIIGIVLVILGFGPISIIIALILAYIILLLFTSHDIWKYYAAGILDRPLTISLFRYGLPVAMATTLQVIGNTVDRFLLVAMDSLSAAGIYSVSANLIGSSLNMLLYSLSIAAYPIVLKALEENNKEELEQKLNQYASVFMGFALPSVAGLIIISPNLLYLLLGKDFLDGSLLIFPWLVIAELFFAIQVFYFAMAFQIKKKTVPLIWIMLIITVINIILNIILIPEYSIVGVAIATMISSLIGAILTYIYGSRLYKLPIPFLEIAQIIFATLIMIYAVNAFSGEKGWAWLVVQISTGAVVYLAIVLMLNISNIRNDAKEFLAPKINKLLKK
jgi:O-antigen/teichoic acid export membrane protein